jgi:hypothetical protein
MMMPIHPDIEMVLRALNDPERDAQGGERVA